MYDSFDTVWCYLNVAIWWLAVCLFLPHSSMLTRTFKCVRAHTIKCTHTHTHTQLDTHQRSTSINETHFINDSDNSIPVCVLFIETEKLDATTRKGPLAGNQREINFLSKSKCPDNRNLDKRDFLIPTFCIIYIYISKFYYNY